MSVMVKVKYPDGHVVSYQWITGSHGYIRTGRKILRYPLPTRKENELEAEAEEQ